MLEGGGTEYLMASGLNTSVPLLPFADFCKVFNNYGVWKSSISNEIEDDGSTKFKIQSEDHFHRV